MKLTAGQRKWRQRCRLFEMQNGDCYYCKQPMILMKGPPKMKETLENLATIEHLHDRFDPERGKHGGEYTHVLACWKCNTERGRLRQAEQPLADLHERSGRHPGRSRIGVHEAHVAQTRPPHQLLPGGDAPAREARSLERSEA